MKVFLGSSQEAVKRGTLSEISVWIEQKDHTPVPWNKPGLFLPGKYILERIIEISKKVDAAVFIFGEDDKIWYRGDSTTQARDNVMIEYGLFAGILGKDKVVICVDGRPRTPSDLSGIIVIDVTEGKRSQAEVATHAWLNEIQKAVDTSDRNRLSVSFSYDKIIAEYHSTLDELEADNAKYAVHYKKMGDRQRLLDGLYSGLLYASRSIVKGEIDPLYYGNLMELDKSRDELRVKYFAGPYNERIITRRFSVEPPNDGVASVAFRTSKIQIINSMERELKLKGEERLKAMMSIPVEERNDRVINGTIVVLNIDSGQEDVFPTPEKVAESPILKRADELANLIRRVNTLSLKLNAVTT